MSMTGYVHSAAPTLGKLIYPWIIHMPHKYVLNLLMQVWI